MEERRVEGASRGWRREECRGMGYPWGKEWGKSAENCGLGEQHGQHGSEVKKAKQQTGKKARKRMHSHGVLEAKHNSLNMSSGKIQVVLS